MQKKHEIRPWGVYFVNTLNKPIEKRFLTNKIIFIKNGEETSLQFHRERSEFWHFLTDTKAMKEEEEKCYNQNDYLVIPIGCLHKLKGEKTSFGGSLIQEFSLSNSSFSEYDIIRLKDKYGRVKSK